MSLVRGKGRRERAAGNRHRRSVDYICGDGSESGTYKLGRKKFRTHLSRSHLTSSSVSSNGREAVGGAPVAETEMLEPACAGAPMVGPERVSNPSYSKPLYQLPCPACEVVMEGVDFPDARFWLQLHWLDIH